MLHLLYVVLHNAVAKSSVIEKIVLFFCGAVACAVFFDGAWRSLK